MDLVQSLNHKSYHNFYHKFGHNCGFGVQGKLSWRTWHYLRWIWAARWKGKNACMHACMGGSGQQGGKLSQDGKLSQGRPGRKCMHVWIWAARWKANARWKAIARLKAIARCTQVRQVEPGPSSWAAMVGSLSKFLYRYLYTRSHFGSRSARSPP